MKLWTEVWCVKPCHFSSIKFQNVQHLDIYRTASSDQIAYLIPLPRVKHMAEVSASYRLLK